MAGFLRKKSKQDQRTKPGLAQTPPPSSPTTVPPLFARFSTTAPPVQEHPRIVSSPMLLSSARRDAAAPHQNHNRGSRTIVPSQRDAAHWNASHIPMNDRDISAGQGSKSRQPSPTQIRARPESRAPDPKLDKPLPPPSFELDSFNSSAPAPILASPPAPALAPVISPPRPLSSNHPSPIQGEYAHLWSIIAGDDKLPEPVSPSPAPSSILPSNEEPNPEASGSNHLSTNVTSPSNLIAFHNPRSQGGPETLPELPPGAQKAIPPMSSSFREASSFHEPNHSETATPGPSNPLLSRRGTPADENSLHWTSEASANRTMPLLGNVQYGGSPGDVFGSNGDFSSNKVRFLRACTMINPWCSHLGVREYLHLVVVGQG